MPTNESARCCSRHPLVGGFNPMSEADVVGGVTDDIP